MLVRMCGLRAAAALAFGDLSGAALVPGSLSGSLSYDRTSPAVALRKAAAAARTGQVRQCGQLSFIGLSHLHTLAAQLPPVCWFPILLVLLCVQVVADAATASLLPKDMASRVKLLVKESEKAAFAKSNKRLVVSHTP